MQTTPYIVGKRYLVPTVRGFIYHIEHDWPVIGTMHDDVEIIGFPHRHYHIDWRFVPANIFKWFFKQHGKTQAGIVLMVNAHREYNKELPDPVSKRLLCKREFDEYPRRLASRVWLNDLEDKYQDCKLKTMVCPHRGLPLDKLPCKHDGTVTCPGHGLTWNTSTGEMVRFT